MYAFVCSYVHEDLLPIVEWVKMRNTSLHLMVSCSLTKYVFEYMKNLLLLKKGEPCQRLYLIKEMSPEWKVAGSLLGLSAARLEGIKKDQQGKSSECCRDVMQAWLDNGGTEDYQNEWKGVLELLIDLKLAKVSWSITYGHPLPDR